MTTLFIVEETGETLVPMLSKNLIIEGIVEAMDNRTHTQNNYNLSWPVWNDGCYIWNINETTKVR